MAELTDEQIVQDLVDIGRVPEIKQDVWLHMEGYRHLDGFGLNRKYGVGTRTFQRWAAEVRVKMAERRAEIKSGRVKFGHTTHEGSRTRFASDGTPIGRLPGSSWSEDRLKAQFAGTQRKRAAIPPRTRRKQVITSTQRADKDYGSNHEK